MNLRFSFNLLTGKFLYLIALTICSLFLIDKFRNSNLLIARRFHSKDWNHTDWHKSCLL